MANPSQSPSPSDPFHLLSCSLQELMGRVGDWHRRGFLSLALHLLLWRRLSIARVRIEALVARYLAGTVRRRAPRVGVAAVAVAETAVGTRVIGARVWPGQFGWLLRRLQPGWLPIERSASWEAGQFAAPLRHALEQPAFQALLRDVPQAARILGPVCGMLGIERSVLRPGVVVRPVVARVRVVRPKVDFGDRPLPRGMGAAIRRDRRLARALALKAVILKAMREG